jgi:hypothetical protein
MRFFDLHSLFVYGSHCFPSPYDIYGFMFRQSGGEPRANIY